MRKANPKQPRIKKEGNHGGTLGTFGTMLTDDYLLKIIKEVNDAQYVEVILDNIKKDLGVKDDRTAEKYFLYAHKIEYQMRKGLTVWEARQIIDKQK